MNELCIFHSSLCSFIEHILVAAPASEESEA
jgi:hypothetical protein